MSFISIYFLLALVIVTYYKSVTQPLEADATDFAYLYNIPFECFKAG
ncbi:hypothetical protein JCM19274_4842 [Algibacter lectus]|uniref:Uncharacterized protein n=1 Tax=Algibacter lectus TaxID=221126 RepID=A0A090WQ40_9FLAO|nr:hypothetical protein JCM19274_4842 [Algibacter lectus]